MVVAGRRSGAEEGATPTDPMLDCLPSWRAWHYWALVPLFVAQVLLVVFYHLLTCHLTIANTLLLLIILAHQGFSMREESRPLLLRYSGLVAFLAVLFLTVTHSLEMFTGVSESDESDHSHADTSHEMDSPSHGHEHGQQSIPVWFAIICIYDAALKGILCVAGIIPDAGMGAAKRFIFNTITPLACIAFYVVSAAYELPDNYFTRHADPVLAISITLTLIWLAVPAFRECMPYIFAANPSAFDAAEFQTQLEKEFSDVVCNHLHVYRQWPGNKFEGLIHITLRVDKKDPDWAEGAQQRYEVVNRHIRQRLLDEGATKVVVEPRFERAGRPRRPWRGCVDAACTEDARGCCEPVPSVTEAPGGAV